MIFNPGDTAGQEFPCEIVKSLSGGHMAEVYLARLKNTGHRVVVKAVSENVRTAEVQSFSKQQEEIILQQQIEALTREAQILKQLRLEGIPEFYGYFEEPDKKYFIMSYHEGVSLEQYMLTHHELPEESIRDMAIQICRIFAYLHRKDIVYGDLKPSNLLIEPDGRMVLIDFGMAVKMAEIREKKAFRGTLGYAPPECWHSDMKLTPATDIFALGATLFYLLEGRKPRECYGNFVLSGEYTQKKNRWQSVLDKCCALEASKRYQSATEVFEALSKISL